MPLNEHLNSRDLFEWKIRPVNTIGSNKNIVQKQRESQSCSATKVWKLFQKSTELIGRIDLRYYCKQPAR